MIQSKNLWVYRGDSENDLDKNDQLPVSALMAKVLNNRGIKNADDMMSFLHPDYSRLYDPFLLKDMEKAVDKILKGMALKRKITIYGDYDVDGITSTSILYMFLKENGGNVDYYIPDRIEEGYGLNIDAIRKIKDSGTDIIITVDTGIAAVNEAKFAKELGIDLIITDHHECQSELPEAYAVIDPKQKECSYPFKLLAGVGVTFKLIHGLAQKLRVEDRIWKYIDIVAVGTVADVVSLVDENRVFVKKGFESIPNTWNIGLKALLKVSGYKGGPITAGLIGFGIAPRLNAAGRIGDAKRGIELFITQDENVAVSIAEELNDENRRRQEMEQKILEEALELIEKELDLENTKVIVIASEKWHHGVIGIAASKIMEKFYRPTILMCIEDGMAKGSARSVTGFNIFEALSNSSQFLERFGGHEMAAGLSMPAENIDDFRIFINEYANNIMDDETLIPKIYLDAHIKLEDINLELVSELTMMEPYGVGNPQPLFSLEGEIQSIRPVGKDGNHLKIVFTDSYKTVNGIGFGLGDYSKYLHFGRKISAVVALEINEWNQVTEPQLLIKDLKYTEEDEMHYNYYLSLYDLFKHTEAMPTDVSIALDIKYKLSAENLLDGRKTLILVHTKTNLINLMKEIKNHQNLFNKKPKVWYTNNCGSKNQYDIVVNPIIEQIDFDGYEKVVLYDPLWSRSEYDLIKKKVDTLYWVEKSDVIHRDEIKSLIPDRQDFAVLYRHIKLLESLNIRSVYLDHLLEECNKAAKMNEFKILLCMDVFKELGLMYYNFDHDHIFFQVLSNKKVSLEDSKVLQKMIRWGKIFEENQRGK
ncbi:MAG: exonuclease RecJ [Defluviitaleaceae bacterium]|jgi:single-stranded-DNA-specific exonuclease|nr:exonuclease RecJ [Defluviitaleaceae bacterium]